MRVTSWQLSLEIFVGVLTNMLSVFLDIERFCWLNSKDMVKLEISSSGELLSLSNSENVLTFSLLLLCIVESNAEVSHESLYEFDKEFSLIETSPQ